MFNNKISVNQKPLELACYNNCAVALTRAQFIANRFFVFVNFTPPCTRADLTSRHTMLQPVVCRVLK